MESSLVFTLVGPDRPGLVQEVSNCVCKSGGNWDDCQLVQLSGYFAGLVRVRVDTERADALRTTLMDLNGLDVNIVQGGAESESSRHLLYLELLSADRVGIVSDISRILTGYGANIEELHSSTDSAPMTGETLFRMNAVLTVEQGFNVESFRKELEDLADELVVDTAISR